MPTKTQLINGNFQDVKGNVLANGYLMFKLSSDEVVSGSSICAGVETKILLDSTGNVSVSPTQSIWGTDVMSPVNAYYTVTGYTANGQIAWGPNNQQVISGSTFDLDTWVPNQVFSWSPSVQGVTLETNSVVNANQTIANFVNTTSVTWASTSSGNITATASGGATFNTSGAAFFYGGQTINASTGAGSGFASNNVANQVCYCVLNLLGAYTISKIATRCQSGSGTSTFGLCAIYTADGNTKLLDAGNNAFNTSSGATNLLVTLGSPVVLNPGNYIFAWGGTSSSSGQTSSSHPWTSAGLGNFLLSQALVGTAANAISGGNMPATLGALTGINTFDLPTFAFLV